MFQEKKEFLFRQGKLKIFECLHYFHEKKYLNECIDSILSQTYTYFELILVDDGSTDDRGSFLTA